MSDFFSKTFACLLYFWYRNIFVVFKIIKSFSVPISFLENLCLNSSNSFLSFFNFLLLTLISGYGYGVCRFGSGFGVCGFGSGFASGFGFVSLSAFTKSSLDSFS